MITGAMVMPWMFSCRRFVAPTFLQHLRGPFGSRVAEPLEAGKYIGIYWINEGRVEDHEQWALGSNYRLHAEGPRQLPRRRGRSARGAAAHLHLVQRPPRLDLPRRRACRATCTRWCSRYKGLVVQVIDAVRGPRRARCAGSARHLPAVGRAWREQRLPRASRHGRCPATSSRTCASSTASTASCTVLHFLDDRSPRVLGRPLRRRGVDHRSGRRGPARHAGRVHPDEPRHRRLHRPVVLDRSDRTEA